jgi:hypothetical protein
MQSVDKRILVVIMMTVDIVVEAFMIFFFWCGSHLFSSTSLFPLFFTFYPLFLHGQILLYSWSIGMPQFLPKSLYLAGAFFIFCGTILVNFCFWFRKVMTAMFNFVSFILLLLPPCWMMHVRKTMCLNLLMVIRWIDSLALWCIIKLIERLPCPGLRLRFFFNAERTPTSCPKGFAYGLTPYYLHHSHSKFFNMRKVKWKSGDICMMSDGIRKE